MVPGFVSMVNDLAQITHLKRFSVTNKFDCRDSNNIEVTLNANGATLRTVCWNLVSSPVNRSAACVIAISAAILRRTLLESGDVKDISMMASANPSLRHPVVACFSNLASASWHRLRIPYLSPTVCTRTLKSIGRGMSWPSDTLDSLVSS